MNHEDSRRVRARCWPAPGRARNATADLTARTAETIARLLGHDDTVVAMQMIREPNTAHASALVPTAYHGAFRREVTARRSESPAKAAMKRAAERLNSRTAFH